jgi:hypothetical protein
LVAFSYEPRRDKVRIERSDKYWDFSAASKDAREWIHKVNGVEAPIPKLKTDIEDSPLKDYQKDHSTMNFQVN